MNKSKKELLRKTLYMEKHIDKALKRFIIGADEYNHNYKHEYEVVEAALKAFIPEECFKNKS
ncbi:MAG TPA: hypothetical protein GXX73_14105 [Clostridium sp.]|nr:hypothetical protein [Clostridium sp.]